MDQFYQAVYSLVSLIPSGKVATYGQIATLLGRPNHARSVGWAMRNAPTELKLPCHRVIQHSGTLAPEEVFGAITQKILLMEEGITFTKSGKVNLKKHLWQIRIEPHNE